MKTALIIVSVFAGLATIGLVFLGMKNYKQNQILKDQDALYKKWMDGLPTYADNATAIAGGLMVGKKYKTPANEVKTVTA